MTKFLLSLVIAIGLTQITTAQITCLPCDQLVMSVNVGSDTNSLSIYHSGQYLTHPQESNVFAWDITDMQGNIIFQDTLMDNAFCNFSHNFPITDTMNVIVYLTNNSAILPNGNPINCFFEDQIYWETGLYPSGTPWGRWEFVHGNVGIDMNNVSGINAAELATAVLYPNPTNDLVNISLDKGQLSKIELFTTTGRLIFTMELNSAIYTLNISDYQSGAYLVRVCNQNNDILNTRIVKK